MARARLYGVPRLKPMCKEPTLHTEARLLQRALRRHLSALRFCCHRFNGAFNRFWHHSELVDSQSRRIYAEAVSATSPERHLS